MVMNASNDYGHGYDGVRVVVLGASGFIGRWVARYLSASEADLHLVVRQRAPAERVFSRYNVQGEVSELDLRNFDAVRELLQAIKPSITFNLAVYGVDRSERDELMSYQINAQLIRVLCETIAEIRDLTWVGRDIVHVGSALEYGSISGDLSEDSVPSPTTTYCCERPESICILLLPCALRRTRISALRGSGAAVISIADFSTHFDACPTPPVPVVNGQ